MFSGDTRKIQRLSEFATGADVLVQIVQNSNTDPVGENYVADGDDDFVWSRYIDGNDDMDTSTVGANHCSAAEAGEIAAAAGVETLVLTHIMPYRDLDGMREDAEAVFDGEVLVAEDGLTLSQE